MGDKKNWIRVSALRAACASAFEPMMTMGDPIEDVDTTQTARILDRAAVFADWLAYNENNNVEVGVDEGTTYYTEPGEHALVFGDFSGEIGMRVHTCSNDECSWRVTDYTDPAVQAFEEHRCDQYPA
jgi:hypothetical protein